MVVREQCLLFLFLGHFALELREQSVTAPLKETHYIHLSKSVEKKRHKVPSESVRS